MVANTLTTIQGARCLGVGSCRPGRPQCTAAGVVFFVMTTVSVHLGSESASQRSASTQASESVLWAGLVLGGWVIMSHGPCGTASIANNVSSGVLGDTTRRLVHIGIAT